VAKILSESDKVIRDRPAGYHRPQEVERNEGALYGRGHAQLKTPLAVSAPTPTTYTNYRRLPNANAKN
jgi:hypothetical protein